MDRFAISARSAVSVISAQSWDRLVARRVDPTSLAVFRMLFGLVMVVSTVRFVALGWVDEFYVLPSFHFTWDLAPWVRPLPPWLMHLHFVALSLLAFGVGVGFHYRLCATLFFLGFTYVELIDKTTYLNHYYLVSLVSGLLIVLPADRVWSVDAWRQPAQDPQTIPAWTVNLLRFQIAVVYAFAGFAKINADWLLDAQPLRIWLAARSDLPIVGPLLDSVWAAYAFSWFGAAYDLTIVMFLLSRRTRPIAYFTVVVFHAMTAVLFPIGMFPWIMIVATLMFFPPDWPRRWAAPGRGDLRPEAVPRGATSSTTVALLVAYAIVQIALPLRAYWPGADPEWTNRGFNFAWRVMLAEKAGHTELIAVERTGRRWPIRVRDYVTERQEKMMAQDPFMIRALARHVAADLQAKGKGGVEVRAESFATLNGRPLQRLIDPEADLARRAGSGWIVPLHRDRGGVVDLTQEVMLPLASTRAR